MKTIKTSIGSVSGAVIIAMALFTAPAIADAAGTQAFDQSMQPVLASYLKIQEAMAADSQAGVQTAAKSIAELATKLDASSVGGEHAEHYKHLPMKIRQAAATLSDATTLEVAREAFKKLSQPMAMWGTMSKPAGVDVVFCSMAKGSWLQKSGQVMNPYYGKSMLHCGEVVGGATYAAKGGGHAGH